MYVFSKNQIFISSNKSQCLELLSMDARCVWESLKGLGLNVHHCSDLCRLRWVMNEVGVSVRPETNDVTVGVSYEIYKHYREQQHRGTVLLVAVQWQNYICLIFNRYLIKYKFRLIQMALNFETSETPHHHNVIIQLQTFLTLSRFQHCKCWAFTQPMIY